MIRKFILRGWSPQLVRRQIPLLGVALSAAFSLAALAAGNPKLLMDAQQLLDAENPKQAYKILFDEQKHYADDRKFDYLLGVAALGSSKIEDSIIALERVLAAKPSNAEASMYLGKAYFLAGSMDLAEATFRQLQRKNPPPLARATIDQYLQAIAQRRAQGKRAIYGYGELSLGYDSNITGVPSDFTAAVVSAFNIPGIDPTGNSIKRKAAYMGAAAAVDYVQPFNATWSGVLGAEARGRAYRHEGAFNSVLGDVRGGVAWNSGVHGVKVSAGYSQFKQKGDAPGDPMPTNDRKMTTLGGDYRYALSEQQQLNVGLSGSRVRFPQNDIEDFDAVAVSAGWQRQFTGSGMPVMQVSGYYSRDEAVRKLADGVSDKSKHVGGLRSYYQYSLSEKLSLFNGLGFTTRRDQSAFARATQVEFGRDQLTDITLGVNWRFQPKCALRAQWFGSRNDSNIAIYDYTRNEMSSNIRCEFM
ncbi:MAG: tetratricopeptide repeat protein [Betaproteobacteria bacterium]|nr:tetratricopeptide repeat protein [Betaproteobacteria bacterium]